jgi:hypothetical protein
VESHDRLGFHLVNFRAGNEVFGGPERNVDSDCE